MEYRVERIVQVSRYKKLGEEVDRTTGIVFVKYYDRHKKTEFSAFKSKEDARKYWEYWIGHDPEALKFYISSATIEGEFSDFTRDVIEFETPNGNRYLSYYKTDFSFGKDSNFTFGVHVPKGTTPYYPTGWWNLNVPMKPEDKLIIGVGSQVNMGKAFTKELTIDEFIKLMEAKGKFYTPFVFENNKRNKANAYRPENSLTMICIDVDDDLNLIDILKEKDKNGFVNSFLNRVTYYLEQVSKSGEGYHFFVPVKVKDTQQLLKILNYLQLEYKGIADISVFEPARLIFSSPYRIKEVSRIAVTRNFYADVELTQLEPASERLERIKSHQLTIEGHKNYVRNDGALYIRTYVDGDRLVKWFEEKHGKLTSKKLFSVQVTSNRQSISSISNENSKVSTKPLGRGKKSDNGQIDKRGGKFWDELKASTIATVKGDLNPVSDKSKVREYQSGLIGLIKELSKLAGFKFYEFNRYDKDGNVVGNYYQISVSPDEKSPMDIFLYDNNPEFFYFQSKNALRHFPKIFEEIVSYTTDGRPCLHISWLIKLLSFISKNFKPDFNTAKIKDLIKKYGIHEKYLYSHFEEVEGYVVELIKALIKKKGKPVRVSKYIPKEIISKSRVWRSFRKELESLGFVFERKRGGLVVYWDEEKKKDIDYLKYNSKGLSPKLRKTFKKFFAVVSQETWFEEIVVILEENWVKHMVYWVRKMVGEELRKWEMMFKRKLRSGEMLWYEDKQKPISALSYVITRMVA